MINILFYSFNKEILCGPEKDNSYKCDHVFLFLRVTVLFLQKKMFPDNSLKVTYQQGQESQGKENL